MTTGTNTLALRDAPGGTAGHYLADLKLKGSLGKILGPFSAGRLEKPFEDDAKKTRGYIEAAVPR